MPILYPLAISGLLNGIGALFIGFLAVFKKRKDNLHRVFALLNIAIAIWALSYWRWLLSDSYTSALFWVRMLSIGSTLIPIFFLHWMLILVGLAQKKRMLLRLGYLMTIIFLLFNFSPYFVENVEPTFNFPYWPKPGILYHFYIFFSYLSLLTYGVYRLFKGYREAIGHRKAQMKYVFLGLAVAAPAGFTNFPLWYNINIPPYGNFFVLAYVICYGYAMLRYRLMDIRVVMGRTSIYVFSFLSVIGAAFLLIFLNTKLAQPLTFNLVLLLGALLSLLFFQLLKFYERIAARYFYHTFYNTQIVIADLEERLTRVLELETLSALILNILKNTLKLEKIGILAKGVGEEKFSVTRTINSTKEELFSLIEDGFLPQYLENTKKPIVREELTRMIEKVKEKEKLQKLQENLKRIKISLCLPLIFEGKIISIIVLGDKISQEPFFSQDIELLTTLSRSASIALKNASLYSEVKNRKMELEKFYRLTVGRELRMIELKKKTQELEEKIKREKGGGE